VSEMRSKFFLGCFVLCMCIQPALANEPSGSEYWPPVFGYTLKISDSLLVAFTMVLAIFTGMLWWSTNKLWKAGERQADLTKQALISGQRAWISVSMEADGDCEVGGGSIVLPVKLKVTNIGNTPAMRAHTFMKMVFPKTGLVQDELRALCAEQLKPNDYASRLVLPKETYDRLWVPTYPDESGLPMEDIVAFWPHIIGCVSYQVLGDDTVHQTAFVYGVSKGPDQFSGFIDKSDGTTPRDILRVEVQSGGFAT